MATFLKGLVSFYYNIDHIIKYEISYDFVISQPYRAVMALLKVEQVRTCVFFLVAQSFIAILFFFLLFFIFFFYFILLFFFIFFFFFFFFIRFFISVYDRSLFIYLFVLNYTNVFLQGIILIFFTISLFHK